LLQHTFLNYFLLKIDHLLILTSLSSLKLPMAQLTSQLKLPPTASNQTKRLSTYFFLFMKSIFNIFSFLFFQFEAPLPPFAGQYGTTHRRDYTEKHCGCNDKNCIICGRKMARWKNQWIYWCIILSLSLSLTSVFACQLYLNPSI